MGLSEAWLASNGWARLPGGLIIQWFESPLLFDEGYTLINYPIAFPTKVMQIIVSTDNNETQVDRWCQISLFTNVGCSIFHNGSGPYSGKTKARCIALGY